MTKSKIFDCITFFDNNYMFNLRYNILKNYVDYFVICESKFDHRGNPKNLNFIKYEEYDFSIPRRENKTGKGHRGFLAKPDPTMSFEIASSRRDFTINGMGYDLLKKQLLDPFNGLEDLNKKIIRFNFTL